MALLTTQTMSQAGLTPTLAAATSGGDTFAPTNQTFLMVKNASGGSVTVTIITTAVVFSQNLPDIAVVVANGATTLLGPYDPGEVAAAGTGLCAVTYSSVTSVTVAAIQT